MSPSVHPQKAGAEPVYSGLPGPTPIIPECRRSQATRGHFAQVISRSLGHQGPVPYVYFGSRPAAVARIQPNVRARAHETAPIPAAHETGRPDSKVCRGAGGTALPGPGAGVRTGGGRPPPGESISTGGTIFRYHHVVGPFFILRRRKGAVDGSAPQPKKKERLRATEHGRWRSGPGPRLAWQNPVTWPCHQPYAPRRRRFRNSRPWSVPAG